MAQQQLLRLLHFQQQLRLLRILLQLLNAQATHSFAMNSLVLGNISVNQSVVVNGMQGMSMDLLLLLARALLTLVPAIRKILHVT